MPPSSPAEVSATADTIEHPRLWNLIDRARQRAVTAMPTVGIVHACDVLALQAAHQIWQHRIARPVLIGPLASMQAAADTAQIDLSQFECIEPADSSATASGSALCATQSVHQGRVTALMKGALHTDELMAAVVKRDSGLRTSSRISHAFVFDLPRYHKLLALADCVVNISPHLKAKTDILGNAVVMLQSLGIAQPKVAVVSAVETVNEAIPATVDAKALVEMAQAGYWPGVMVEGPFGFDNAFSARAAATKGMRTQVSGEADLMIMPDLNAGNMLYKSFVYVGGAECAGLVLGAQVPIVLTSRADSVLARIASVALSTLMSPTAE